MGPVLCGEFVHTPLRAVIVRSIVMESMFVQQSLEAGDAVTERGACLTHKFHCTTCLWAAVQLMCCRKKTWREVGVDSNSSVSRQLVASGVLYHSPKTGSAIKLHRTGWVGDGCFSVVKVPLPFLAPPFSSVAAAENLLKLL